ncbi:glycosyltransferase [Sphingobium sp.]|uniref:glycosyltransferase n=1 Tax=Sphingobium sp. TaxID=1912891 RepID=UPI002BF7A86B|nr:glycosyltransferase [Sphingobium sp.]HUD94255.1 glycosyltransferase [Sphingobium sp.]
MADDLAHPEMEPALPVAMDNVSPDPHPAADALFLHVHQILIAQPFDRPLALAPIIDDNVDRLRHLYPESSYRLWTHDDLRDFLAQSFPREVCQAFDRLRPYAYKADLGRLCLLHAMGGLYSDISFFWMERLRPPPMAAIASFLDVRSSSPAWTALSNGLIWARPGRQEMAIAIDMILANCRNHYYGLNSLHPTGPVLLGRAFVKALAQQDSDEGWSEQWVGHARFLTPMGYPKGLACFTPDGKMVAISRKEGGTGLGDLQLPGGNNYNDFWNGRTVYGEDCPDALEPCQEAVAAP